MHVVIAHFFVKIIASMLYLYRFKVKPLYITLERFSKKKIKYEEILIYYFTT